MRFVLPWVLVACGRFGFADQRDATTAPACPSAVGHDEDGDGIDDACDVCPELADAQQVDRDGDGVGDACDPHPDAPIDTIAEFDPFTSLATWTDEHHLGVVVGDDAVLDATGANYESITIPASPGNDTYEIGFAIHSLDPTDHQVVLALAGAGFSQYYCELLDRNTPAAFGYTFTDDGMTFNRLATANTTELAPAEVVMQIKVEGPASASVATCFTTWPAARQTVSGVVPQEIAVTATRIAASNIRLDMHWFLHIHTTP